MSDFLYPQDHLVELVAVNINPDTDAETPTTGVTGGTVRYALTDTGPAIEALSALLVETATLGTYRATFSGADILAKLASVGNRKAVWRISTLSNSYPPITRKLTYLVTLPEVAPS